MQAKRHDNNQTHHIQEYQYGLSLIKLMDLRKERPSLLVA